MPRLGVDGKEKVTTMIFFEASTGRWWLVCGEVARLWRRGVVDDAVARWWRGWVG